jgi:hypothetical protein
LQSDRGIDENISHRIRAKWVKWRQAYGILCDTKIPNKLKDKFYRTAIRPAMMYDAKCKAIKEQHIQKMSAAKI